MDPQQTTSQPLPTASAPATPEQGNLNQTPVGRTVRAVRHGHTFVPSHEPADARAQDDDDPRTSTAALLPATEDAVERDLRTGRFDATTSFDYLFRDLRAAFPAHHLPSADQATVDAVVAALDTLGDAMVEATPTGFDASAPAVYTYWGQFIDHDITLNTNGRDKRAGKKERRAGDLTLGDIVDSPFTVFTPDEVVAGLHNGRHPALNLDSLYGSGPQLDGRPAAAPTRSEAAYVPFSAKLALGRVGADPVPGFELVPPVADLQRDLPRLAAADLEDPDADADKVGSPRIPDGRNDENLVVAQLHVAMIRFHNAVVDWVRRVEPWVAVDEQALFDRAQELVRHHYQWLVLHDYLRTLLKPGVLDTVLVEHALLYRPARRISMPLEFAAGAFRFGHSMVRGGYDFNVNFGRENPRRPADQPVGRSAFASLEELFQFTHGGGGTAFGGGQIPSNWPIDWQRFVDKGDPDQRRRAHRIDPFLAKGLQSMVNNKPDPDFDPVEPQVPPEVAQGVAKLLQHLARRNLRRGYWIALPTGEAVARELGITPLTREQLVGDDAGLAAAFDALEAAAGPGCTPLWYYVLREAEVQGNGAFLGEVGSRILAETFVYLLREDEGSFLRVPTGWSPVNGVRFDDGRMITTLPDLLRFAGVLALDDGAFRTEPDGTPAGHDGRP